MPEEISKETQQIFMQFQVYQQQLQSIIAQKENLKMQQMEIDKAVEEMEKAASQDVYKLSGPILIKAKKVDVKKDMEEKKELMGTRIKTLERSEKAVKEKLEGFREKLTNSMGGSDGVIGGG